MHQKTSKTAGSTRSQLAGLPRTDLLFAMGALAAQTWVELGTETVRFVCDRMKKDIMAQQAILACNSFEELQNIQTECFALAQQDYAAEMTKMIEMASKMALHGMPGSRVERRFDDVPL